MNRQNVCGIFVTLLASVTKGVLKVIDTNMFPHVETDSMLTDTEQVVKEPTISKSFLERIIGKSLDYPKVISENTQLTQEYNYIVKSYGFETFYDLYLFADTTDNSELVAKGGQKDLQKLKPVTRTVIRNGKPMKTTIYEDTGSKEDNKNPLDKTAGSDQPEQPRDIGELTSSILDMTHANPKELARLAKQAEKLQGTFNTDCSSYVAFTTETGELGAIIGFKVEGNYLRLVFTQADKLTNGVSLKAFFTLTVTAWKQGLGAIVSVTDNSTALALFKEYGYTKAGDTYKATASKLKASLGTP